MLMGSSGGDFKQRKDLYLLVLWSRSVSGYLLKRVKDSKWMIEVISGILKMKRMKENKKQI